MSSEDFPFEQIPPLSLVVTNVIRFDHADPDASIESLQQLIAPDKGITAEILKIVNSALYGRSGKIKTLKEAIGRAHHQEHRAVVEHEVAERATESADLSQLSAHLTDSLRARSSGPLQSPRPSEPA